MLRGPLVDGGPVGFQLLSHLSRAEGGRGVVCPSWGRLLGLWEPAWEPILGTRFKAGPTGCDSGDSGSAPPQHGFGYSGGGSLGLPLIGFSPLEAPGGL